MIFGILWTTKYVENWRQNRMIFGIFCKFWSQVDFGGKIDSTWVDLSQSAKIDLTQSTGHTSWNLAYKQNTGPLKLQT